jgi:imidazolonepropionase-like amidohydrolase
VPVLRAARLFDGERIVAPGTVRIDDGRVSQVGFVPVESDPMEVTDLGDATILPGFVDCHQHLSFDGNGTLEEQVRGLDEAQLLDRALTSARRALRGGVTTLRDLGDRGFVTLALRGDESLPTILASGPPITCSGGHCWYLGGGCADTAALLAAVAERADAGCDVVKVMASGGYNTPTSPMWESQFDDDDVCLVVDEAHGRGLPVAAHCHGVDAIEQSLRAGVDSIEHCSFFTSNGRSEPDADLIERLARSGIVISATVGRLPHMPVPEMVIANAPAMRAARRRLHEHGATIVAGTDAGITPAKPHDVLPYAMNDFVDAGMTPVEALRALTTVAARALGLERSKGRLATGFDADVVVVRGNPLAEPSDLTSVIAVWRAGVRVV